MISSSRKANALREQGESGSQNNTPTIVAEHYGEVKLSDLSTEAQRQRLLNALQKSPITTLEARRIDTVIIHQATETGIKHRVAKYVLQGSEVAA